MARIYRVITLDDKENKFKTIHQDTQMSDHLILDFFKNYDILMTSALHHRHIYIEADGVSIVFKELEDY